MMESIRRNISVCISEFNLAMYLMQVNDSPSTNVFLSPTSVSIVMLMVYIGARKRSEDQMAKALQLKGIDKSYVLGDIRKFMEKIEKELPDNTVKIANNLFPHCDKRILETYISTVKKYFHVNVKPMDFTGSPGESRVAINEWVKENTNNKITEILPEGSLTPLTAMVVVNAIYFKGNWEVPFEPRDTEVTNFNTLNGEKVKVKMMRAKKMENVYFHRSRSLNCKILKLRYDIKHIGMLFLLPSEQNGLPRLESRLDLKTLKKLICKLSEDDVEVSLPKFKMETTTKLKPLLCKLGMEDIFDENKADLSGTGDELYVSEVYHKTFIDVNEEGTEAGAVTAAVEKSRSLDETLCFNGDHPFMFVIWHDVLDVPLFIGRLLKPEVVDKATSEKRPTHRSDKELRRERRRSCSHDRHKRKRHRP